MNSYLTYFALSKLPIFFLLTLSKVSCSDIQHLRIHHLVKYKVNF